MLLVSASGSTTDLLRIGPGAWVGRLGQQSRAPGGGGASNARRGQPRAADPPRPDSRQRRPRLAHRPAHRLRADEKAGGALLSASPGGGCPARPGGPSGAREGAEQRCAGRLDAAQSSQRRRGSGGAGARRAGHPAAAAWGAALGAQGHTAGDASRLPARGAARRAASAGRPRPVRMAPARQRATGPGGGPEGTGSGRHTCRRRGAASGLPRQPAGPRAMAHTLALWERRGAAGGLLLVLPQTALLRRVNVGQ